MGESLREYTTSQEFKNNKTAKHEALKDSSTASYPFLIKIRHNNEVYRYAKYFEDVTFFDEVYLASDFTFTPPEESIDGIKDAHLTISDVDQSWTERIRKANTFDVITVEFVAVIVYDDNGEMNVSEIESILFNVRNVNGNGITLDADLVFDERTEINVPCDIMDSVKCAGCA